MLNNYIGGGQVFLHKIRMFLQVFWRAVHVSVMVACLISAVVFVPKLMKEDLAAAFSYRKAVIAISFDEMLEPLRQGKARITRVDASTGNGVVAKNMEARRVLSMNVFKTANGNVLAILANMLQFIGFASGGIFLLIFVLWYRFGKSIKSDHKIKGGRIMTANEVSSILRANGLASSFKIGNMPLVKDSETRHFLICGATGSGKTNLIDTILPQVERKKQPAIVIDQTGEMIAK